jgi:hypothetical protein
MLQCYSTVLYEGTVLYEDRITYCTVGCRRSDTIYVVYIEGTVLHMFIPYYFRIVFIIELDVPYA